MLVEVWAGLICFVPVPGAIGALAIRIDVRFKATCIAVEYVEREKIGIPGSYPIEKSDGVVERARLAGGVKACCDLRRPVSRDLDQASARPAQVVRQTGAIRCERGWAAKLKRMSGCVKICNKCQPAEGLIVAAPLRSEASQAPKRKSVRFVADSRGRGMLSVKMRIAQGGPRSGRRPCLRPRRHGPGNR